jgi:hypothetical protein
MASSLEYRYTGGAGNTDPDASLGGTGSSEIITTPSENNIFDNINPPEIESGDRVEYRAIDIYNDGDAAAENVQFYLTDTPNVESTLATWYESSPGQTIANETTEPIGASWSQPLVGSKLSLNNLAAAARHRIWIRRTIDQGATNISSDEAILHTWFS